MFVYSYVHVESLMILYRPASSGRRCHVRPATTGNTYELVGTLGSYCTYMYLGTGKLAFGACAIADRKKARSHNKSANQSSWF